MDSGNGLMPPGNNSLPELNDQVLGHHMLSLGHNELRIKLTMKPSSFTKHEWLMLIFSHCVCSASEPLVCMHTYMYELVLNILTANHYPSQYQYASHVNLVFSMLAIVVLVPHVYSCYLSALYLLMFWHPLVPEHQQTQCWLHNSPLYSTSFLLK